jgi:hypothetical protein
MEKKMNPLPVLRKLEEVVRVAELKRLQEALQQAKIVSPAISTRSPAKKPQI